MRACRTVHLRGTHSHVRVPRLMPMLGTQCRCSAATALVGAVRQRFRCRLRRFTRSQGGGFAPPRPPPGLAGGGAPPSSLFAELRPAPRAAGTKPSPIWGEIGVVPVGIVPKSSTGGTEAGCHRQRRYVRAVPRRSREPRGGGQAGRSEELGMRSSEAHGCRALEARSERCLQDRMRHATRSSQVCGNEVDVVVEGRRGCEVRRARSGRLLFPKDAS